MLIKNTAQRYSESQNNNRFIDKRLVVVVVIIVIGLLISANLLLSIGQTSQVYLQLEKANQLLRTSQEFEIQYDVTNAAITTFMFLGSDETWDSAQQQSLTLAKKAEQLVPLANINLDSQYEFAKGIRIQISKYIEALPPLRKIRQDFRGVVEGVVQSNNTQATQHYMFMASLTNAIETLSQDPLGNKNLIIQLQSVQNRWLRIISEFRALLLLRSDRTERGTLLQVEQFEKEWRDIVNNIDDIDFEVQAMINTAHKNQQEWIDALPNVIKNHFGKRWRRDLRYMEEQLNPISKEMLTLLNGYELNLAEHIKITANKIVNLEKNNLIWIFVVMGLIIAFSLAMLFIYKRLLDEQRRKRLDAEHVNKMKTDFLSTISHELRTPLNAILGFSQLLEMNREKTLTEQQKTNISEINSAGTHLLHLVNEVLDLSTIESGNIHIKMQSLNLTDVLNESVSMSKTMSNKYNVHISVQHTRNIEHYVIADPTRLRQIFINLISNAIKYNKKNGDILICIKPKRNMTRISIIDTGCGISKEDIKKLFQPFERLGERNKTEGAGIGLVVTKELVTSMKGNIGVDSVLGEGTTFWIELISA